MCGSNPAVALALTKNNPLRKQGAEQHPSRWRVTMPTVNDTPARYRALIDITPATPPEAPRHRLSLVWPLIIAGSLLTWSLLAAGMIRGVL